MPAATVDAKKDEVVEVGEAGAASVESSPISVGKGTPKENRDSGHESSATSTPDAERAMTPELKEGEVPEEAVYILHIELPSGDKFDVQVNNTEMLQEIHQVLLEREGTCHRTCYTLQLEGKPLDHFTEIRNVPGLKSGSTLAVVEEPYTLREARIHVRHVRDLSRMPEQGDAASAVDGMSLSYLPIVGLGEKKQEKGEKEKTFEGLPPEYVLPGTKERSLSVVIPSAAIAANKTPYALKNLGLSPFNPPLPPRKMKGDVLYLFADTLEKRRVHITCCTQGFYVNGSDENSFKPTPASGQKNVIYHSLVDLIASVSPLFKKNFTALIKKRVERPILDRLPTPYPQFGWLAPATEPVEDALRADDATQPHRVGIEEHLPGQIRDWNEELQTTGEMARTTLSERINRDRSVFKIHSDFISASVKGAQAVVEGNVMAINPADDPKTHMYIWNNIFFSLGFDVKDHYKEFGGDAAAFAATAADLQGVRAYSSVCDESKLSTLGMAIVDYRGFRVTAQSIIPGILEREQEQSVVYGSIDTGKTVVSNEKYHELLDLAAKELKMLPHEVWNGKEGDEAAKVKLYTSFETKGIIGNDSRYYVLDLLRTFPPDVHYLPELNAVSDFARESGYPHEFPHKLVAFRHELVNAFVDASYMKFVRVATYHIQMAAKERKEKQLADGTEVHLSQEDAAVVNAEAMKKAAESVHSLRPDEFDIRFNPDCFSTTVKHADEEDLEAQRRLVVDCGEFLLKHQIPSFVEELVECTLAPIDGEGLVEQMHARGINVRYIGQIAKLAPTNIAWLRALIGSELVVRATKHVFRGLFQSVKADKTAAAAAHLLSCLLAAEGGVDSVAEPAKRKAGKKGGVRARASTATEWEMTSQKSLWKAIREDLSTYYQYELQCASADALFEEWGVQKTALLRRMCRAFGIQLLAKDYNLFAAGRPIFVEDDVQNVFPVTKHREPEANDAKRLFTRGSQEMANGRLKEAYEYIAESVNLMTSVYGAMHGELAQALRSLARLSYILGDPQDALAQQHRAAIMAERCYGLDHAETITEYVNLAHMAFSNLLVPTALKLLYRARHLLLIAAGESHPFMSTIDGNIGVILFAVQEFDLACKFIQSAEKIAAAAGETKRLKSALLNHVMGRAHACRGDFRTALAAEKETYTIYSALFGVEHEKTKESNECLRQLTQQAVQFQKKMQDMTKGAATSLAQLLPNGAQQPSLSTIIDVLNVVNGIIVFSIREGPSNGAEKEGEAEGVEGVEKLSIEEVKEDTKLEEEALD